VLDAEPRLEVDYVAVADFGEPTLVAAVRAGSTRLIDNVVLRRSVR
jgi:pantothenate synthetase